MKSITLSQTPHYAVESHPTALWIGLEEKPPRCKSVDSFNFLMNIIDKDRYADINEGKSRSSIVQLRTRTSTS